MDLKEKDEYIETYLMKLEPDTLRFMVADLTSEVQRLEKETAYCGHAQVTAKDKRINELVADLAVSNARRDELQREVNQMASEIRTLKDEFATVIDALKNIVTHQRGLRGTPNHDKTVFDEAYTALNTIGLLDRPTPR